MVIHVSARQVCGRRRVRPCVFPARRWRQTGPSKHLWGPAALRHHFAHPKGNAAKREGEIRSGRGSRGDPSPRGAGGDAGRQQVHVPDHPLLAPSHNQDPGGRERWHACRKVRRPNEVPSQHVGTCGDPSQPVENLWGPVTTCGNPFFVWGGSLR